MAGPDPDTMDWRPTDDAESDPDFDPADNSDCESEDPFWELDEKDATNILKKTLGEDVEIGIDNFLDPLPVTTTPVSTKGKHKKPTPPNSPERKRQKVNTTPVRRPKPQHKKADITPHPKFILKRQKTPSYDPEDMVEGLINATKFWAPVNGKYHKFIGGQCERDLAEATLQGLKGLDNWRRWRKAVMQQFDRIQFRGMEMESYNDTEKFIIFSICPPSTREKNARENALPTPQLSPDRKRFVKISLGTKIPVSGLAMLDGETKEVAEFVAAFLRHHGFNIEEVHAFLLHVASCKQAIDFVKLWGNGKEISNWDSVKESAGFQEDKFAYIFRFLYETNMDPREKETVKAMMTSWAAKGWDKYDIWKETTARKQKTPKGATHGAHRLSKSYHKGCTPVVFRVDYRSEERIFRSTSTLEPSFPSNDKKQRFWILNVRRPDDKYDTETCYVAFARSPTNAYIKKMEHALKAALPWSITSISSKQGKPLQADAFDMFGRIHPRVQPLLNRLVISIISPQSPPEKILLHSLFKGTKTKSAGSLLVILLRVSRDNYSYSSPLQQLRQILSKLPEHPGIREGKVSGVFLMFERESSFMKTWDDREVRGKVEERAAGRPVHLCTARPTRGTRQVADLDRIRKSVTTWQTLGVAGSKWVDCFDPKWQDKVEACILNESNHLEHTLHVNSRDRSIRRFVALQACKPESEDIKMLKKFALAQLPQTHPVRTVTRSSPFTASSNAGREKERLVTQKRHQLHQQFLQIFAPEAENQCLMNTTAYTDSQENDVSKVLEEVNDPTIFLFTAIDRIAHTPTQWQKVKEVAQRKGHTVMVLFLYGEEPLSGSSVFHELQDCKTEAAEWEIFMTERTNSDNIYGLIQPTVVIAPGRKIHKDVEGLIQRSFEVSEAFVQAKEHTRGATRAAFSDITASLADRSTRWDAALPVLKQAVEQLTDLPGVLVEADQVTPDRTGKECTCGTECFDTCSCLRYGCHPLPSLCGHLDKHGQPRPRVSLAAPNCIECTQEQSPCLSGCHDADNQAIPALALGLCKKCLKDKPCIRGADCEGVRKTGNIGSRWRADLAKCKDCALEEPCENCNKPRQRLGYPLCKVCHKEAPCGKGQDCVGFEKNGGKPNERGEDNAKFCRECRAKSQGDCPLQPLGCSNTKGMYSGRKLPSCIECGTERRFCSRKGCTGNARERKPECGACTNKPAKDKTSYITCTHDDCKEKVWLWKGLEKEEWLTKEQLLAKRQFCLEHLVEHLLEEEHAAEGQGSASGDDASNANNSTETARAEQADTWLRESCWNDEVRTSINNEVTENGVNGALAVASSMIDYVRNEKEPEYDDQYTPIVIHFVTVLALQEDHSFTEDVQKTIRGSPRWLQKIYAEVLAENKQLTPIKALCKTD